MKSSGEYYEKFRRVLLLVVLAILNGYSEFPNGYSALSAHRSELSNNDSEIYGYLFLVGNGTFCSACGNFL